MTGGIRALIIVALQLFSAFVEGYQSKKEKEEGND